MSDIAHTFIILSGKGGVGKSSVAVNLAVWLSAQGRQVGLLDADIHGPSVPKLLDVSERKAQAEQDRILPIDYSERLKVMSVGFLLPNVDEAIIWRGPMKHNLIQQFVSNVDWGSLDYLVVDCPPGTGDEPLSVVQVIGDPDGAVIVTTPQELAAIDVRKCITFCRQLGLPVLGIIENMSGFVCPHCGKRSDIFAGHSGREMAEDFKVPFLGSIPIDPALGAAADRGKPFVTLEPDSPTAKALQHAFEPLIASHRQDEGDAGREQEPCIEENRNNLRIAVPVTGGKLSPHFGRAERFAIVDVDRESRTIKGQELVTPPEHQPGMVPEWLSGLMVNLVIASGMSQKTRKFFAGKGIEVLCGAPTAEPQTLVRDYLDGRLDLSRDICDH